jgi:hypothetical protein
MMSEIQTGNHSRCSGNIVKGLVMISLWYGISYLNDWNRKLVCECEMLQDYEKRRRAELESMFGVDFSGSGAGGLELV